MGVVSSIVVVGGGITGLAAALRLTDAGPPGTTVTVLEQAGHVGGKLRTGELAGIRIEEGADAFLVRVPDARTLAERVGLGAELVHPATGAAAVCVDGTSRPLPTGTVLGIPADLDALAASGVLSPAGLARVRAEPDRPGQPLDGDVAVGALVRDRLGAEVADRLVDPLLGGVYAGRADNLSLRATMPAVAAHLSAQPSVVRAAQTVHVGGAGPVFATVRGGLSRLVERTAQASGATVRTGVTVRELHRTPDGWRLLTGSTRDPEELTAAAVVLAVPAAPAARLLAGVSPRAAAEVGGIGYASLALVTLLLPTGDAPGGAVLPAGSGMLVPAAPGRLVKAVSYLSQKWAGLLPADPTVVRASVGRHGEETALHLDDAELVRAVWTELGTLVGAAVRWPSPVASRVVRWGGALPQYAVGHPARVGRVRAELADHPTLAVGGAAYDGVGIPACIRSGQAAADRVLAGLSRGRTGR